MIFCSVMMRSVLFLCITIHAVISYAQVTHDDLNKFAEANNILAQSLYPKLINGNSENVFFYPLSLMTGLGIMLYGAAGNTEQELYSVLGYKAAGLPIEKIAPTYYYYLDYLLIQNDPTLINYDLFCADEVLVTNQAILNCTYKKEDEHLYFTPIKSVKFSKTNKVVRDINDFVKNDTHGKIPHLVDSVNPSSSTLLIDVAYFKGKWQTPFPQFWTLPQTFHSSTGKKDIPFMWVNHRFPYYDNNEYKALLLPYIGNFLGLLILLPHRYDGLSNMEKTMTTKKIVNTLNHLKKESTFVTLPKFKLEYYRDFSKDFEDLGANEAYNGPADFSRIAQNIDLSVSGTLHKALIEVDEAGQGVGESFVIPTQPCKEFFVNHPFMFAVVDIRYNLLVGLGRVMNL